MPGTVKSEGLEITSKWKTNDFLNFDLNYTYTSTYDGAEQDNPDNTYINAQMVRVPRHFLNLGTKYIFPNKNLNLTLQTKLSSKARDYGNANEPANGSFADVKLNSYMVNDLSFNYNLFGTYKVFFDVINIFDKKYTTALQYSQMDRSFNFGIKRKY
jgi:vitamin B12 transporter